MLRVSVGGTGESADAVAVALERHGIAVARPPRAPVALAITVTGAPRADEQVAADVILTSIRAEEAAAAAGHLYSHRLAPWVAALASGQPDVVAPPRLLPHDPRWGSVAVRRCDALRAVLGDAASDMGVRRIDHIGSTAVPGLAAKAFLDLQLTCDRLPDRDVVLEALAPLGWAPAVGARPDSPGVHRDLRGDRDTATDEAFRKYLLVAPDPVQPAILHVRLTESPFARRVVRFRDELRTDPDLRRDYERMKQQAAAAHAADDDYDDYTREKGVWLAAAHARVDDPSVRARDPWPLDR